MTSAPGRCLPDSDIPAGVKTGKPEIPKITPGADVTPEVIHTALKRDSLQTVQGMVSIPAAQRYVAGKVVGVIPEIGAGTLSPSNIPRVKPMHETIVDPTDWGNN